uniref:Amidase domain-containing protein n=1 Tax=Aegilops tauschii subsp. strangulata TaxID=200361 RepID=A0A453JV54_AEGTS
MRTTALPPTPALPPHPQRLLQWLGRRRRCQSHRLRPGTDSCGSVRVPAAYCGIFGLYPSHGLVSTQMFKTVVCQRSSYTVLCHRRADAACACRRL